MSKMLEIKACDTCFVPKWKTKREWKCIFLKDPVPGCVPHIIVDGCLLPNKPEPITEKDLALFWVKKLTDKEICDAINAHFLK